MKYISTILSCIFTMAFCQAAEEDTDDRIAVVLAAKMSTPIHQQLEQLDASIQQAIEADRPLILAFGANRLEASHFKFPRYENPFVVYIQKHITTIFHNELEFKIFGRSHGILDIYKKSENYITSGCAEDADITDAELKDFVVAEIQHPSLIAGDILDSALYSELSARYAGRFDLITTDLAVTAHFDFTKDALLDYLSLLKKKGIMAFTCRAYSIDFNKTVHDAFVAKQNIKPLRYYFETEFKADYEQWRLGALGANSSYSPEEIREINQKIDTLLERLRLNRVAFSYEGFLNEIIQSAWSEYYNFICKNGDSIPSLLELHNLGDWLLDAALIEDKNEFAELTKMLYEQNIADGTKSPFQNGKDYLERCFRKILYDFFSADCFDKYEVACENNIFPYASYRSRMDYIFIRNTEDS